ncbi:MAG TPA: magnesium transporter CorA family protein [Sphingomicrobium sp.]|nr:magnesium transporter CorA family protein [Sphingomicrobium sp.]
MLRTYGPTCDGSLLEAKEGKPVPNRATWIDLEEPTREEEKLVERCLGIGVPTRDDMVEIEPSSRLYEKNGALYMTMSVLFGVNEARPASEPISFVLTSDRLVTIRYVTPKPVLAFIQHVRQEPELARDALTVMLRLLDAIIERLADELEDAGAEIEKISANIFQPQKEGERRAANRLEILLTRIGRAQQLVAKVRETAVSTSRLITFLAASERMHQTENVLAREYLENLAKDAGALIDHSAFLSSNLTFMLDASLGLISIEQNGAMKLFSWAALIFLPPTLIAGIYGMNFEHMPELKWLFGYPFAVTLMVASSVLPIWILKRRGWI